MGITSEPTVQDWQEGVRQLQREIDQLRAENRLLKEKLSEYECITEECTFQDTPVIYRDYRP
jgi:hypothetical protein